MSRSIIGESTARICRSTYDSHEHSIIATLATQMRQSAGRRAASTEIPALWLDDIAFDAITPFAAPGRSLRGLEFEMRTCPWPVTANSRP